MDMSTKRLYGFDYKVVATKDLKSAIANNLWVDNKDNGFVSEWWKVAKMDNGDEIWEENYVGTIAILSKGETSYWRNA